MADTACAGRSSSETARGREGSLLGLSPLKAGPTAALSAPSADKKRAMGTPDYLAPEVLLGEHEARGTHLACGL